LPGMTLIIAKTQLAARALQALSDPYYQSTCLSVYVCLSL